MGNEIRNQQPAKKALMTASMASMLDNFNRNNIKLLLELGYTVTLAANFNAEEDSSPPGKLQRFRQEMEEKGCRVVHIDFSRKLSNIRKQFRSYRQIRALAAEKYDLVHCHSPICAALTRLVFRNQRKLGTKVIYTAHGFHFFRGAPVKNWLLYFPVEWACARWTDILNTINREDYERAKRWLKAGKIVYLPGVGIDLEKFKPEKSSRQAVRMQLGIKENEKMLLSVGELSRGKNLGNVIKALWRLNDSSVRYIICGQGTCEKRWKDLAARLGIADQVIFLGYQENISEICQGADLFIFPSLREGLPMALLEAIATKTPVICSNIRGNRELVREKEFLFNPQNVKAITQCIRKAMHMDMTEIVNHQYNRITQFSMETVMKKMEIEYAKY